MMTTINYRGFQLLPGNFGHIFVNFLGRFYPPYLPGGGCGFDDVKYTNVGGSKLSLTSSNLPA